MRGPLVSVVVTFVLTSAIWIAGLHFLPKLRMEFARASACDLNPGTAFFGLVSGAGPAVLEVQELERDFGPVRQVLVHYEVPLNETRRFAVVTHPNEWPPSKRFAQRLTDLFRGDTYPSYINNRFYDWELVILGLAAICLGGVWFLRARRTPGRPQASVILICLVPFLAGLVIATVEATLFLYPQTWIGPPPSQFAFEATFCAHIGLYCTLILLICAGLLTVFRKDGTEVPVVQTG